MQKPTQEKEWYFSFMNQRAQSFSRVQLSATPWTVAHWAPVHSILQARLPVWVAISSSRGSSQPRDWTHISCVSCGFFTAEPPGKPNKNEPMFISYPLCVEDQTWYNSTFFWPQNPFPRLSFPVGSDSAEKGQGKAALWAERNSALGAGPNRSRVFLQKKCQMLDFQSKSYGMGQKGDIR